jgi:hypothetical protein
MEQTLQDLLKLVRPHTKSGILREGKKNIRMETSGEPTDRMSRNKMAR